MLAFINKLFRRNKNQPSVKTEQQAAQDSFEAGYHDVISEEKLRNISFTQLAILLESSQSGTARHSVIEREIQRRKSIDALPPKHKPSLWFHPVTKLLLRIAASVIAAAITYFSFR